MFLVFSLASVFHGHPDCWAFSLLVVGQKLVPVLHDSLRLASVLKTPF